MPATDLFPTGDPGNTVPAENAAAVTPHDSNDLTYVTRGLYVGGAGNVEVIMHGTQQVVFSAVPAGTILPIRVSRVTAANTTATLIVALW